MFKASYKYLLLFLVLIFSFVYRMIWMTWQTFPPGADIGLHNSIIHSITVSGGTNFLWNYYQMGGGISLTFPGYHIFASYIMLITGMPDYLAQSLIVSFFSSLIVLCAFLITRTVWGESVSLIVAFLVAISRFDVEMLLWGGYPNVITLMLIPLTFYLYLQREKFSLGSFLATTSILSAAIFLTHSLSAVIFVGITVATVVFVLIFSKRVGVSRTNLFIWLAPIFLGVVIVSPFLIEIVPAYFSASGEIFTGAMSAIRQALLATRVLPLELVLPLLVLFPLFFLFSKGYKGKFFTVPAFLLALWILVPTVLTQAFLIGLYTDYNRFLYFVVLPVIILVALAIDYGSRFFSRIINTYLSLAHVDSPIKNGYNKIVSRLTPYLTRKNLYSAFVLILLLLSFLAVPIFLTPQQGATVSSFYQAMDAPGYEAVQWVRQNTPVDSIFVSDAWYGWWLSGFAQRPTLSAVDPQFLTLSREFEPATVAKNLLDTDYLIDNGLIQVREDGGYIGRHNPIFLAKLNWTYFPYPFFQFNNSEITLLSKNGEYVQSTDITQIPLTNMEIVGAETDNPSVIVNKGNSEFNYSEIITVQKGVTFANMTLIIQSNAQDVSLDWINFILNSQGKSQQQIGNTIAMLDVGMKECGQLIFAENQPEVLSLNSENPCITELSYNLQGQSTAEIQILVGIYQVSEKEIENQASLNKILVDNIDPQMRKGATLPLEVFDYQEALKDNEISYIACRDSGVIPKFAKDSAFSLVFINNEVAIFMVKKSFNQPGRPPSA
jgi:hypothetical protein